jgi:hypothetical protein
MWAARSMQRIIVIVGLFCLGVLLASDQPALGKPARKKRPHAAAQVTVCKVDSDCALVTDGCCNCNQGGKQRVVFAKARVSYEKKRKARCRKTMCTALMSEDPSCVAGSAVCKDGTCTLGL